MTAKPDTAHDPNEDPETGATKADRAPQPGQEGLRVDAELALSDFHHVVKLQVDPVQTAVDLHIAELAE